MSNVPHYTTTPLNEGVSQFARTAWKWVLGLGIIALVFGLVALAWPKVALTVIAVVFGLYLLVFGAGQLLAGLAVPMRGGGRVVMILVGALTIVLGVLCLFNVANSLTFLGIWIGIGWLASAITRLVHLGNLKGLPGRGWSITTAVIEIIGALVLILFPFTTVAVLTWIVAILLVAIGIFQIVQAISMRSRAKTLV